MSVAQQNSYNGFAGDAATTIFSLTFAVPSDSTGSDILVYVIDASGNITLLGSNYTLDLVGKTLTYPVTPGQAPLAAGVAALPVGWQLYALRIESMVQPLALTTQGPFPAAGLMLALDKQTMMIQQLQDQINRCIKYPIGQTPTTTNVADFINAVAAILLQMQKGTYANLKIAAAANPTRQMWGWATDLGASGQLMFYGGDTTVGDGGWFGPLAGA